MKKKFILMVLVMAMMLSMLPVSLAVGGMAYASNQFVEVDGQPIRFQMYALKDANGVLTNYVKLRDVAHILNGTKAQFSVGYDGFISIITGQAYTDVGSEMTTPYSGDRTYQNGSGSVRINGKIVNLESIVLTDDLGGGYTYFKLRDLGSALGFKVDWNEARGVIIKTNTASTPAQSSASSSYAERIYQAYRQQIEGVKNTSPVDMDRLWSLYKGLLLYRMYEVWFRVYAEDYYTGELGSSALIDELSAECKIIQDEMRGYFNSDSVDSAVSAAVSNSFGDFVDRQYPFERVEVLNGGIPDVDAMWEKLVRSKLKHKPEEEPVEDKRPLPNGISTWSGVLGKESWCKLSFSYPSAWDDLGFAVLVTNRFNWLRNASLYEMRVVLNDFGVEQPVFHIEFVVDFSPINDTSTNADILTNQLLERYPYPDPIYRGISITEDQGVKYWVSAFYKNIHPNDMKDWRRANWDEVVNPYVESVLDSVFIMDASWSLG